MGWEHQMALMLKAGNEEVRRKAIEEASAYIGTIESTDPLKVSILGGESIYDESEAEIFQTRVFLNYSSQIKKTGAKVLVLPIDTLDTIAVIDIVEEG